MNYTRIWACGQVGCAHVPRIWETCRMGQKPLEVAPADSAAAAACGEPTLYPTAMSVRLS